MALSRIQKNTDSVTCEKSKDKKVCEHTCPIPHPHEDVVEVVLATICSRMMLTELPEVFVRTLMSEQKLYF